MAIQAYLEINEYRIQEIRISGRPLKKPIRDQHRETQGLHRDHSRQLLGHQEITEEWWRLRRADFELYVSQSVLAEAAAGDSEAARHRLKVIEALEVLEITQEAEQLAIGLVGSQIIPKKAAEDALHVAIATLHGMDYLLTWNCRHIANAEIRKRMSRAMLEKGYDLPVICTPEELEGG